MSYGLSSAGFLIKPLQQIKSEIEASLQGVFGANINLLPESVFGQLVGIFSEREALLWELSQAVYSSQYPSGAEGTSVDNILALNNLRRLKAAPSKTSPDEGDTPGLLFGGTPGTVIPAGSIISVAGKPSEQFTTDADVTIVAAVNDVQKIIFNNVPTVGLATFEFDDSAGNTLTSPSSIGFLSLAAQTVYHFNHTNAGQYKLTLTATNGTPLTTILIDETDNAATVQAAIRSLAGYSTVTVASTTSGLFTIFTISWGSVVLQPIVTFTSNTLTGSVIGNSIQSLFQNIHDSVASNYPYTDVTVTGDFSNGFTVTFGAGTVTAPNPVSSSTLQHLSETVVLLSNTLEDGTTTTTIKFEHLTKGHANRGTGSATCTQTGALLAPASTLTVIGSPLSGWTSVTNPLDVIPGNDLESDTAALQRRTTLLASQGNSPLQAIIAKVAQVSGVTSVIGFENNNNAPLQNITFSAVPTSGNFQLRLDPLSLQTGNIAYTATSAIVQAAVQALSAQTVNATVSGDYATGFTVDFQGAFGGQFIPLFTVPVNTLDSGGAVNVTPAFGRPGHSFEVVVVGGGDQDIANAIYAAKASGITAYGTTHETVVDSEGFPHAISFSRPVLLDIYVSVSLVTSSAFPLNGADQIRDELVKLGAMIPVGGLVVGFGSNGLIGAFNDIPGITSYTLNFGKAPSPSGNSNIQLLPEQEAHFEPFNIDITVT